MIKSLGGNVFYYVYIYSYFYVDHDYDTGFHMTVMLRSTTGPYGRPVIEVAYGEMIFSLHRGCMRDDSSRRVVRVSVYASPMFDILGSTPVWAQCIIFRFSIHKYMYMYTVFKSIYSIKEHWWSLILS